MQIWPSVDLIPTGRQIVRIIEHYPRVSEVYVTSGADGDHGPRPNGSHHYGHLSYNGSPTAAIDLGAGGDTTTGRAKMAALCRWLESVVGVGNIVELINSQRPSGGYYIKHGRRVGAYDRDAHFNHVHLAMSAAQAASVLRRLGAAAPGETAKSVWDYRISSSSLNRTSSAADWLKQNESAARTLKGE